MSDAQPAVVVKYQDEVVTASPLVLSDFDSSPIVACARCGLPVRATATRTVCGECYAYLKDLTKAASRGFHFGV